MARRMDLLNKITKQLAVLAYEIELMNRSNRMTLNSDAETIFCGLINRLEGWNLRNLNEVSQNYPGIDLADPERRIAVQITASASSKKVSHTLEIFFKNHMEREFDRLVLVITTDRTAPTNGGTVKPGFRFDPKKDIWNIEWFKRRVEAVEDCELLQAVADYLDSQLGDLPGSVKRPDHLLPPVPSGSEFFLAGSRDAELDALEKALEKGGPVFIWGLGGMGKTEVAIALAKRCAPPRGVYFLRYAVPDKPDREAMFETIRQAGLSGYRLDTEAEIPPEIRMEREYREKLEILRREYADTMLIIDNFDWVGKSLDMLKAERSYQDVAALANNGVSLVFTTRYPADPSCEIGPLPEQRLLELMRKSCADYEDEQLLELIRAVGGHTLMVNLMAKTLEESWQTVTPAQILESLKNAALDAAEFPEVTSDKDGTYAQAQIYRHLQALFNLSSLTAAARKVLAHATLLSTDGLDDVLFLGSLPAAEKKELQNLCKRGWLRREDHVITIHPAVLQVCRSELEPSDSETAAFLEALWDNVGKGKCPDAALRRVAMCLNNGSRRIRNGWIAAELQQRALSLWEQILPADDPGLARRYSNAGRFFFMLGKLRNAKKYTQKSLRIKKQILPWDHPDIAKSYRNLSLTYVQMGDEAGALEYQLKALEIWEKVLPADHPDLAECRHQVGMSYFRSERYRQALDYLQQALDTRTQILTRDHPDLLESHAFVGRTLAHLGCYGPAKEHLRIAVQAMRGAPQSDPKLQAFLCLDYSEVLLHLNETEQGCRYAEHALRIFRENLPDDSVWIREAEEMLRQFRVERGN